MAGLTLRIITPERVVLDEAVDSVRVPASDGSMGVFPKHAGMVTALDAGELLSESDVELAALQSRLHILHRSL